MARTAEEIEDRTPLDGAQIDVAARIGWLLRTSRITRGVTLRDLGAQFAASPAPVSAVNSAAPSPATLSRIETAGRRSGLLIDVYERGLGLPHGHLRVPIDVLCRTFAYAPPDLEPWRPAPSLAEFSEVCAAVRDEPTGLDWLRFAEHHTLSSFGLPADDVRPLIAKLASEVGRATGRAYQLRYEALSKLRCSPYGDVVADVIHDAVLAPGVQRSNDLLSAVTEQPTAALLEWCGELLDHPSWLVARAACLGIQNIRSVGDLGSREWEHLTPRFAAACDARPDDPRRSEILSSTLACCPPAFRTAVHARLQHPLAPPRRAAHWTRSRRNQHYNYADTLAERIAGSNPGGPMLTRLIFELLYDFRATHVVTSSFLLVASPFEAALCDELSEVALHGPDEVTRHGAAFAFANLTPPIDEVDPEPWLASPDPQIRAAGLSLCGFAGVPLERDLLARLTRRDDEVARDALFAAGMAAQPELDDVARDPAAPEAVRTAARWWQSTGGRVRE